MTDLEHIRSKYGKEIAFVVLVCRVYFKKAFPEDIDSYVANYRPDWQGVYAILKYFPLRPLFYKVISALPQVIDRDFVNKLHKDVLSISIANMEKLSEMRNLAKEAREAGIKLVPYKGILLSHALYGDYISRETDDLDFLVSAEEFSRVRELFLGLGYQSDYYYDAEFEPYLLRYDSEYQFYKILPSGNKCKVEVHWNVIHGIQDTPLDNETLFGRLQTSGANEITVDVLRPEDELLVMIIHHGVNDIWRSLKHMTDVAAFVDKHSADIDWVHFKELTEKSKVTRSASVGFSVCGFLFGTAVPPGFEYVGELTHAIADDILHFPPRSKKALKITNLKRQLSLRNGFADKLALLRSYMSTALTPNMRDVEALRIPVRYAFLYYILKPFRMLFGVKRQ